MPGWESPAAERFGVLRVEPWSLRLMPGSLMRCGEGELLTWRAPPSHGPPGSALSVRRDDATGAGSGRDRAAPKGGPATLREMGTSTQLVSKSVISSPTSLNVEVSASYWMTVSDSAR